MIKWNRFDTDCTNGSAISTNWISFTGPFGRKSPTQKFISQDYTLITSARKTRENHCLRTSWMLFWPFSEIFSQKRWRILKSPQKFSAWFQWWQNLTYSVMKIWSKNLFKKIRPKTKILKRFKKDPKIYQFKQKKYPQIMGYTLPQYLGVPPRLIRHSFRFLLFYYRKEIVPESILYQSTEFTGTKSSYTVSTTAVSIFNNRASPVYPRMRRYIDKFYL